jgi:hypothetical protein
VVLSRLDLAAVAAIALALLWIEHDHRIIIAAPAAAETVPRPLAACPDTDDVPFSAACISFIGAAPPAAPERPGMARGAPARSADSGAAANGPACPPSNETAPYSPSCIGFLSGWYWHPNESGRAP